MFDDAMKAVLDQSRPVSQRVVSAEKVAESAREVLVRLLLQITADESESDEALREFGRLLARVTSPLELSEWDLRDMLEPAWVAFCG